MEAQLLKTATTTLADDKPWDLLANWMKAATVSEINDPDAAALATVNKKGLPSLRMVLVRYVGEQGAYFYTNETSRKGRDLAENPQAALLWHWKSLRLQIRMEGEVKEMGANLANDYFSKRPRGSQASAWASFQSQEMAVEDDFQRRLLEVEDRFTDQEITRPSWWKGYILNPQTIEFWQDGAMRRHDRLVFNRKGTRWQKTWLYP